MNHKLDNWNNDYYDNDNDIDDDDDDENYSEIIVCDVVFICKIIS